MSDYLWDKTGEPDAETERLEELLGQLRFQPTPFDLPAGLPATELRAARPRRSVPSWPRLALAASVTLAVLAGAWLVLKQQTGATNDQRQVASQNQQPGAGHSSIAPQATGAANENNAGDENKANAKPAVTPSQGSGKRREERAAFPHRPRVPDLARQNPARREEIARLTAGREATITGATLPHANPAGRRGQRHYDPGSSGNPMIFTSGNPLLVTTRRGETAKLIAEREAAEKVLYALRVTSEKLDYARRQVREAARGEDNR